MFVGVDNIKVPVTILDWDNGQKKNDVPIDIFS